MLYHLCVGIVALITVLTGTNFRAERTQTKGDTTCNRTLELQVSSYLLQRVCLKIFLSRTMVFDPSDDGDDV